MEYVVMEDHSRRMEGVTARPEIGKRISTVRPDRYYRCAVVQWADADGIALSLGAELRELGHEVQYFRFDAPVPACVDVVLTFAPYGRLLQIPRQISAVPVHERPRFVHWNFEGLPHPSLPWPLIQAMASWRSWVDRLNDAETPWQRFLVKNPPLSWVNRKLHKFRYVGDYYYAYRHGWIDLLVESSQIHVQFFRRHGLPANFVPWGTSPAWHADLKLPRDIDVLWMGTRRTRRRSDMLDQVRRGLAARGVQMYVVDNVEQPFVYEAERTELLNRAKITLSLLPTRWDNAFPFRFHSSFG